MKDAIIIAIVGGLSVDLIEWVCGLVWHKIHAKVATEAEC